MTLPALREELALHEGPRQKDGQPSWTLHDPIRNLFFRLDWLSFEVLRRWSFNDPESITRSIHQETTLRPDSTDIAAVAQFLSDNQLLRIVGGDSSARLSERLQRSRQSWATWLLHHYLFFRVPLLRPDAWLNRWSGVANWFYSPLFFKLTMLALVVGVVEVYRNWEPFCATLVETLSWNGLFAYALTLTGIKFLHELGHAFTAKRYGCRVPTMGLAFLVLWPVAYTDTNEAWKLANRQQRMKIDAAGVATELIVAVWATFAWGFLPDGPIKSAVFLLATSTWLATLAVNGSPFMRFDGYYLLSDFLDMPNLHTRAFALARWDLRERLFKLGEPIPEVFSAKRRRGLILFAWATWVYRLVLFLGIAVLVYHFFFKAIGIALFIVEILYFVLRPFAQEFNAWRERWPTIRQQRRSLISFSLALLLGSLFFIPLPNHLSASGLLHPRQQFYIYAPNGARLASLPWPEGAHVERNAVLLTLESQNLQLQIEQNKAKVLRLRWEVETAGFTPDQQHKIKVLQQELSATEVALRQLKQHQQLYAPRAPFSGQFRKIDPDLQAGQWVTRHEALAVVVAPGEWVVDCYLNEEDVRHITLGTKAKFYTDRGEGDPVDLKVIRIDRDTTPKLENGLFALAAGGSVAVREKNGELIPNGSIYRVTLSAPSLDPRLSQSEWRGNTVFEGAWRVPAATYLRAAAAVFWREAGF